MSQPKITKINYNWHVYGDGSILESSYAEAEVGSMDNFGKRVTKIQQVTPDFEGEKLFFRVTYEDKSYFDTYNPNQVFWEVEETA